MRSARQHADRLGVDYSHFTGRRRWTDDQLTSAIQASSSWSQVATALGLSDVAGRVPLKGHAARLGLEVGHLTAGPSRRDPATAMSPDLTQLPRAGSLMAAAWFTLCGHDVSWPLEPCRYDLLVRMDGGTQRVQVKTTRVRTGSTWTVWLSSTRKSRVIYDPDEIDYFFIIDGDLVRYLIPSRTVGGLHAIRLAAYSDFRLDDLSTAAT